MFINYTVILIKLVNRCLKNRKCFLLVEKKTMFAKYLYETKIDTQSMTNNGL